MLVRVVAGVDDLQPLVMIATDGDAMRRYANAACSSHVLERSQTVRYIRQYPWGNPRAALRNAPHKECSQCQTRYGSYRRSS